MRLPPMSRARSCMPWSPRPWSEASSGSKPRPLSVTLMTRSPSWTSAFTRTIVASACLRTFVSASLTTRRTSTLDARRQGSSGTAGARRGATPQPGAVAEVVDGPLRACRRRAVRVGAGAHRHERLAGLDDGRVERLARPRPRAGWSSSERVLASRSNLSLANQRCCARPSWISRASRERSSSAARSASVDAHAVEGRVGGAEGAQVGALVGDDARGEDDDTRPGA